MANVSFQLTLALFLLSRDKIIHDSYFIIVFILLYIVRRPKKHHKIKINNIVYKAICFEKFNNRKGGSSNNRLIIHDRKSINIIIPKFYSNPRSIEI